MTSRGPTHRDVEYRQQRTVVELDGRLVHATAEPRWQDLERDIDAAISGETTVRLSRSHVTCPVGSVAHVDLVRPAAAERGGSWAPGAADPPRSQAS